MPYTRRYVYKSLTREKPQVGAWINWGDPLTTGLSAAYLLAEGGGTLLDDSVGRGVANGRSFLGPNVAWGPGQSGPAFIGNGSNGYATLLTTFTPASLNLTGSMTVAMLLKPIFSGSTSLSVIAGDANSGGTSSQWWVEMNRSTGSGKLGMGWGATATLAVTGNTALTTGKWASAVWTRSGSSGAWTAKVYVNGFLDNSVTGISTNPSSQNGASLCRFGLDGSFYYSGSVGCLFIWKGRALSATDVLQWHQAPYRFFQYGPRNPQRAAVPASVPGIPTGLSAAFGSATSVTLTWTQGSGTVTDNKVQYSTDDATWTTIDIGSAATSYTVTGLTPGQLYYFQVAAGNTGGFSAYTAYDPWVCGSNFTGQTSASNQDAFQNTLGTVTVTDATDTLVAADYLGFLVTGVSVPQFADIEAAYLLLNLTSVIGIAGSLSVDFQTGIGGTFAATSNNLSNRGLTGLGVTWPIGGLSAGWNQSPDLSSAMQAIVNQAIWAGSDSLVTVLTGLVGAAGFTTNMWDGNPVLAAVLWVQYSVASTDESGTFGDQMGMMAASNAFIVLESQPAPFVAY